MSTESHLLYSQLPAIDRLLREPAIEPLVAQHGQTLIGELLRRLQAEARAAIATATFTRLVRRLAAGAAGGAGPAATPGFAAGVQPQRHRAAHQPRARPAGSR